MAITWSNVTDIAPELSTVALATQTAILAQANTELSVAVWGTRIEIGRAWFAAHLATISGRRGTGGQVTSETVGSVSRSFAAGGSGGYSSSGYGQEFERLLLTLPAARFAGG